jgi:hypothetical protein
VNQYDRDDEYLDIPGRPSLPGESLEPILTPSPMPSVHRDESSRLHEVFSDESSQLSGVGSQDVSDTSLNTGLDGENRRHPAQHTSLAANSLSDIIQDLHERPHTAHGPSPWVCMFVYM